MRRSAQQSRAAAIGLVVAVLLIVAAIAIPAVTGWEVWANHFPPLHAEWAPHLGPGTIPALILSVLALRYAARAAARLTWRELLVWTFLATLLWLVSLALVDGPNGLGAILDSSHEYLQTARSITDVPATLHEYISRIPLHSPDNWPTHVAGHPPGAVLFFWVLVQLGWGGWPTVGAVVILAAATTPLAVLITLRRLAAENLGRTAAPFLVFGPAAIWTAVSADGLFAAVAAWGLCTLAVAATSTRRSPMILWSVLSGLLLGACVMLSYGLPLLCLLAIAILLIARNGSPLLWAVPSAVAVVIAFAMAGFVFWDAYPVLVQRYWDGIAARRPLDYWIWGNLAALAISSGPLVGAAIGIAVTGSWRLRRLADDHRVVVALSLAAVASVVLADLSQMSKAEVERIWLPFVPWLLLATALLPSRWRRYGLAGQLGFAVLTQHLLFTGW
ncbi:hypothetical protein HQQ80_18185 [Microbacteriaceae bacterium VKM Ac-2855]|nr:hypothetical protein [Microbacteriaceae bacterium VKM Ac-2855]